MSANAMISSRFAAISRGREPEQRRGEIDVREPRVLGMEARAELEQRADAAADGDRAARGLDHAGDDLQQRRLARAVLADHAQRLAAPQLEAHAVERAEHARARRARRAGPRPGARGRRARRPSRSPCRRCRAAAAAPSSSLGRLQKILEMRRRAAGTPSARRRTARAPPPARRRRPSAARAGRRAARRAGASTSQPNGLAATQGRTPSGTSVSG